MDVRNSSRVNVGAGLLKYIPLALFLLPVVMHAAMLPVTAAYEGRLPWEAWLTSIVGGAGGLAVLVLGTLLLARGLSPAARRGRVVEP